MSSPVVIRCGSLAILFKTCYLSKPATFEPRILHIRTYPLALKDVHTNGMLKIPRGDIPDNPMPFFM